MLFEKFRKRKRDIEIREAEERKRQLAESLRKEREEKERAEREKLRKEKGEKERTD
jgi:hypothetical protein